MTDIYTTLTEVLKTKGIGYGDSEVTLATEHIRSTLRAYPKCHAFYENGEIHTSSSEVLTTNPAKDYTFLREFTSKEVFTEEENIINYAEEFHDYPPQYKGSRDYRIMKMADEIGMTAKFAMENGNLILVR